MKTITTAEFVFFYQDYMSNWWSTKDIKPQFTDPVTGLVWNNTEEHFMAAKARFFGDEGTHSLIVAHAANRGHPGNVKELGRLVKGYDDKAWSCVRLGAMTHSCYLKFSQNPDLAAQMKATGGRVLVEASPVDKVWGVGLDIDSAAAHAANSSFTGASLAWPGQNLLGKALMQVRSLL